MRTTCILWGAAMVLALGALTSAQPTTATADDRLERLERRMNDMEARHRAELEVRDREIAELKARLSGTQPATQPSITHQDEIEKTKQDILRDIESGQAAPIEKRIAASFNPDIAVVSDFRGNVSTHNANPARNRWDIGSVELDIRAAVTPNADAVVILPIARDVEDPLFFDPTTATGDVNTGFEIEEAYLFLHNFGVPNLTAKLGRYHLRFGRWNQLHVHNWPTVDNNYATQSFFGGEAITDAGLSLSYVIPPNLIGNQYLELIAEVVTGESEAPVFQNNASVDSPAVNTHILWNHDVTNDWNVELGASWLTGKHDNNGSLNSNTLGFDITLVRTDPTGRFNNQVIGAELYYGMIDTTPGDTQYPIGAFLFAQQQLNRDWYIGLRADWAQNALNDKQEVWALSPYVSWYWSEFLRFRLEYQHKTGDTPTENTLLFQATWVIGAHPPHPYWAMR